MKLEVGMYVRTLNGIIKIDKIQNDVMKDTKGYLHYGDFIKASHNIIDLIEVGDYVNGYKVSFKDNDYKPFVQCDYPVQEGTTNHYRFYEEAIYSIVTKEQMEQMEYKVGD